MKIEIKREKQINQRFYIICSVVTGIIMILLLIEFFSRGAFVVSQISFFYISLLLIYSLHKEFLRWLGEVKDRKGEYFVYTWIGMSLSLALIDFFTQGYFTQTPKGEIAPTLGTLYSITIQVGVIFVLTKFIKTVNIITKRRFKI